MEVESYEKSLEVNNMIDELNYAQIEGLYLNRDKQL